MTAQQWQRRRKNKMEVQHFEDPVQDEIELNDDAETFHFCASQIDEIYHLFKVKCFLSSSSSVVLTGKVVGRIASPLVIN